MPSWICDKTGSKLISPAGGSLDARYYDSRDAFGNANIFSLLNSQTSLPSFIPAKLSHEKISLPKIGHIGPRLTLNQAISYHFEIIQLKEE